jgi:hypothetical protein
MKNKTVKDIHQELVNITKAMYTVEPEILKTLDHYQRFEMVFEMVSFLFEDYRETFNELIKTKYEMQLLEKDIYAEHLVFFSIITKQVLRELEQYP